MKIDHSSPWISPRIKWLNSRKHNIIPCSNHHCSGERCLKQSPLHDVMLGVKRKRIHLPKFTMFVAGINHQFVWLVWNCFINILGSFRFCKGRLSWYTSKPKEKSWDTLGNSNHFFPWSSGIVRGKTSLYNMYTLFVFHMRNSWWTQVFGSTARRTENT